MSRRSPRPVVLMVHDYPPFTGGGLALGVREITSALGDEFAFRILSSRRRDHFADDRGRLARPGAGDANVGTLASPWQALRWLREADAVVVHWTFSFRRLSTLAVLAAPFIRKPTVFVVQTAPEHCEYNRLRYLPDAFRDRLMTLIGGAARRCTAVVVLSRAQAAALADVGFPAGQVLPLPVAAAPYRSTGRAGRPARTVLILGELSELKGADAIPPLLNVLAPDFALRVVGRGPLEGLVAAAAASLPAADRANVTVSGSVEPSDVPRLYDETDWLLVLSRTESQSRVTLEAMLSGALVLARPVGGICDLITDHANGFLIDPDDPESVRKLLARLARSPVECDRIRDRARAFALDTAAASRAEWRRFLREVTSSGRAPATAAGGTGARATGADA